MLNSTAEGRKVIYAVCINADSPHVLERVRRVHELGGIADFERRHAAVEAQVYLKGHLEPLL